MKNLAEFCRELESLEPSEIIFAQNRPIPPKNYKQIQIIDGARLIIPLSGTKRVIWGNGHEVVSSSLCCGKFLCIPSLVWNIPLWDYSHKMISLVFRKNYLRVLFIDFNSEYSQIQPFPDFSYHLCPGASSTTNHAMLALANAGNLNDQSILQSLTLCVLRLVCRDLRQADSRTKSKAYTQYLNISEYIIDNIISSDLSRHNIAEQFQLTPQHVSYLFKTFSKKSFNNFVTEHKINYATSLLLGTNMTMDEIAEACQYNYTSYFIKMFKRYHGTSPGKYRLANQYATSS